jgi:hypothetical protein
MIRPRPPAPARDTAGYNTRRRGRIRPVTVSFAALVDSILLLDDTRPRPPETLMRSPRPPLARFLVIGLLLVQLNLPAGAAPAASPEPAGPQPAGHGSELARRLVASRDPAEAEAVIRELATATGLRLLQPDGSAALAARPAFAWQPPEFFVSLWAASFARGEAWSLAELARAAAAGEVTVDGRPLAAADLQALLLTAIRLPPGRLEPPDAVAVAFVRELALRSPGGPDLANPAADPAGVALPALSLHLLAAGLLGRVQTGPPATAPAPVLRLAQSRPNCSALGDSLIVRRVAPSAAALARSPLGLAAAELGVTLKAPAAALLAGANEVLLETHYELRVVDAPAAPLHYGHGEPFAAGATLEVAVAGAWPDWLSDCAAPLGIDLPGLGPQAGLPVALHVAAGAEHLAGAPAAGTTANDGTAPIELTLRAEPAPGRGTLARGLLVLDAESRPPPVLPGAGSRLFAGPRAALRLPVEWHGAAAWAESVYTAGGSVVRARAVSCDGLAGPWTLSVRYTGLWSGLAQMAWVFDPGETSASADWATTLGNALGPATLELKVDERVALGGSAGAPLLERDATITQTLCTRPAACRGQTSRFVLTAPIQSGVLAECYARP